MGKRINRGHRVSKWHTWDQHGGSDLKPRQLHPARLPPRSASPSVRGGEEPDREGLLAGSVGMDGTVGSGCREAASRRQLQTWEGMAKAQGTKVQTRARTVLLWPQFSALLVSYCIYPETLLHSLL